MTRIQLNQIERNSKRIGKKCPNSPVAQTGHGCICPCYMYQNVTCYEDKR